MYRVSLKSADEMITDKIREDESRIDEFSAAKALSTFYTGVQ